jgi:DNA-binding transcriptional ArsR family regulator
MQLTAVLYGLSDPIRLAIVRALSGGEERSCGEFDFPVHKSTMSHHFKVLRETGVIRTRIEGRNRYISLRRADLDARFPGLLNAVLRAMEEER